MREWLVEKGGIRRMDPMAHEGIVRMTAQVKHLDLGAHGDEAIDELPSICPWHYHIGDNQLNGARMLHATADRFFGSVGLQHGVAGHLENVPGEQSDSLFILHQ